MKGYEYGQHWINYYQDSAWAKEISVLWEHVRYGIYADE